MNKEIFETKVIVFIFEHIPLHLNPLNQSALT